MKDSFYFTSEVLEDFSENKNIDKKLISDIYYFYMEKLRESARKKNYVAYLIKNLGTFYITLTGVNYEIKRNNNSKFYSEATNTLLLEKKSMIVKLIDILKQRGAYRIPYFRRVWNPAGIKNG